MRVFRFCARQAVWLVFLSFLFTGIASAGLFAYRLNGGVYNRLFWIDPWNNVNPTYYNPIIRSAVTSWDETAYWSYGCPKITRIFFGETGNLNYSTADFYVRNYGQTGWRGLTNWYRWDGSPVQPSNQNWDYFTAKLNNTYLASDSSPYRSQNTAAHEFGHGIGLTHSEKAWALMAPTIASFDTYRTYRPHCDDDVYYAWYLN